MTDPDRREVYTNDDDLTDLEKDRMDDLDTLIIAIGGSFIAGFFFAAALLNWN